MPRSAKYKGDVEVTGDVGVGGDVFIKDESLLERLTQMQAEIDAIKNSIARLGGRVHDLEKGDAGEV